MRYLKKHLFLLLFSLIILGALLLRIIYLDRVPVGVTNDEINFILNAKAVFLTGKDVAQLWNPLSLTTITGQFPRAELPYLIMALFIGPFDLSLFTGRLPYAVIGTGIILLTALISLKLFGEKPALFVALVGALNPWSIFFSRTAFEVTLAVFFFLLAFYLLFITKGWRLLWSFLPLFIGFYCYMGTKLIFIPLVCIFLFYSWKVIHKNAFLKQHLVILCLCLITFVSFLFRYHTSATYDIRESELYTPSSTAITKEVQVERQLAVTDPIIYYSSNKYTVYVRSAVEKYFGAFSPKLLFTNGDTEIHQTLFYHGNFYYIEIIVLLIGLYFVFRHKRKAFFLLLSILLLAPLPSVFSTSGLSYGLRSALLFPILIIFIGMGIYAISRSAFFQKHTTLFVSILLTGYFLFFLHFSTIYFLRYPIYNSEATNFSSRVLAKFIFNESQRQPIFVVTDNSESLLAAYLFYNNLYTNQTKDHVAQIYNNYYKDPTRITLDNITIQSCPATKTIVTDATLIKQASLTCDTIKVQEKENRKPNYIAKLNDNLSVYDIYYGQYCKSYPGDFYINTILFSDLNVEEVSDERFCTKFILRSH